MKDSDRTTFLHVLSCLYTSAVIVETVTNESDVVEALERVNLWVGEIAIAAARRKKGYVEGCSMEAKICTTLLRILFLKWLSSTSDDVVDHMFGSYVRADENGDVLVAEVFEAIAASYYSTMFSNGDKDGENCTTDVTTLARHHMRENRGKYGTSASSDLASTGRRVRARVRAITEFSTAMHTGETRHEIIDGDKSEFHNMVDIHLQSMGGSGRVKALKELLESLSCADLSRVINGSSKLQALLMDETFECSTGKKNTAPFDKRSALRLQYLVR